MLTLNSKPLRFAVVAAIAVASTFGAAAQATDITGAGSSFVYPVVSKWSAAYAEKTGNHVNYQSIGSGGGIRQVTAGLVDFGASDMPMTDEMLSSSKVKLIHLPTVLGAVVPVYNVPGVGQVKFSGEVLADIYLGKISTWNDPRIAKDNPGVKLPDQKIIVVHRSDGSGTSFIFTDYLSKVSKEWAGGPGKGTSPSWPVGVGGKGNEGVAASVQQLSGSIGYVEYAYAKQTGMTTVQMRNKAGRFVKPSLDSFASAAAEADWEGSLPSMYLVLVDQPGRETWPIAGASFILVQKDETDAARAKTMLTFFDWCFTSGADAAAALDYVAIPAGVYELVESEVWSTVTCAGTPIWEQ